MLKKFLLILLVPLAGITASAYDFEVDGIYYNAISLQDLTCEVTYQKYDNVNYSSPYSGNVVIPTSVTYNGRTFSVTSIGEFAFNGCKELTSVEIPNTATLIGTWAFAGCSALASIDIPNSISRIGRSAFCNCTVLTTIKIPSSVSEIEYGTFMDCYGLISVLIPNSITAIGEGAFSNCKGLASVEIPNSVNTIGAFAFQYCKGLTSVVIPNSITKIENRVFSGCDVLTSVKIPDSVTEIGHGAFEHCNGLASIEIPNSVTQIGEKAFLGCQGLTSVEIPNSVSLIKNNAFQGCRSLKSLAISATEIGEEAFNNCTSLTSVVITNTVTIRRAAFWDCSNLTSVEIPSSVAEIEANAFKYTSVSDYICDNENYVDYFYSTVKYLTLGKNINNLAINFENFNKLEKITIKNVTPPNFLVADPFTNHQYINLNIFVPAVALDKYRAAYIWKDFWNIVAEPEVQCTVPTIELIDGQIIVKSSTKGSECYTSITSDDFKTVDGNEPISLSGIYSITSYAHAEGYQNSETVSAILVWVNPELQSDGILSMEAKKAILLSVKGETIVVSGLETGEHIALYDITGRLIESVKATGDEINIGNELQRGVIYIVKVADKSVKVKL